MIQLWECGIISANMARMEKNGKETEHVSEQDMEVTEHEDMVEKGLRFNCVKGLTLENVLRRLLEGHERRQCKCWWTICI